MPVDIKQRRETVQFTTDEHVRPSVTAEALGKLKPIFKRDGGTVTAGNASGINDGAAMMLVTSERKAGELGLPVAGRLVSAAVAGVDPSIMGVGMIPASRMAMKKAGITVDDLDAVEANEAFSSIAIAVGRDLEVPEEKMNPVGGAIALGHPIGATGAILAVKILHHLARTGGRYGLVTLCIGGGMGIAAIFESVS